LYEHFHRNILDIFHPLEVNTVRKRDQISTFLWYEHTSYNNTIYEIYYCSHKMSYVNVPQELENIILEYVVKGLYNVHPSMLNIDHDSTTPAEYVHEIRKYRFFSSDGKKYSNPITGEYFMKNNPNLIIP